MDMVGNFHTKLEEDMRKKQKKLLHDATRLHTEDEQIIPIMDQSSKGKHVIFEDEDDEVEKYVSITENDIRTDVGNEKSHKRSKIKIPSNVSLPFDDEEIAYVEENMITPRKNKSKVDHSEKIMDNNEYQSESSKGSREIITPGVDLEDDTMKKKQNAIRSRLTKINLVEGGCTFQFNVNNKANEGQSKYQIRKPHHLHVHNLKTLFKCKPY